MYYVIMIWGFSVDSIDGTVRLTFQAFFFECTEHIMETFYIFYDSMLNRNSVHST
jgi:hypothetical protein